MESIIGGIAIALIGALVSILTVRANRAGQRDDNMHKLFDQMQEERDKRDARHEQQMDKTIQRVDHLAEIIGNQADYIGALRQHISEGRPPPPPPYPSGLRP